MDKPKCATCKFYRPHTRIDEPFYIKDGSCDIKFPSWLTREGGGEMNATQSCDFHTARPNTTEER